MPRRCSGMDSWSAESLPFQGAILFSRAQIVVRINSGVWEEESSGRQKEGCEHQELHQEF